MKVEERREEWRGVAMARRVRWRGRESEGESTAATGYRDITSEEVVEIKKRLKQRSEKRSEEGKSGREEHTEKRSGRRSGREVREAM